MNITFLVNAHREGLLLHAALRSARGAAELCCRAGLSVESILVADRPDQATRAVIESWADWLNCTEFVDYGNLGSSRMHGIRRAAGEFVCFMDGDDLWQPEWPSRAYAKADRERNSGDTIYHTEIFAEFGSECSLREQIASEDPLFHPNHLVGGWHYCNNLFASRDILTRYPIQPYDHGRGFGSEDWHWSCETCHAGVRRSRVPETIYFYRNSNRSSLGKSPWLVIRETGLFQTDARVPAYTNFLAVQHMNSALLLEFNAIKRHRAPPAWVTTSIEAACQIDLDLWSLRNRLPTLKVETPRLYAIVAAAFGEMRRLYDQCGPFGIVVIKSLGREPGELAQMLRVISRAAENQPLVVALDRSIHPDQPISREGNLLYIDISFVFEADGSIAYPLRQLFLTAIVQLKPLFFLCVEHWLGETLSPYRVSISELGMRFGYIGACMHDILALRTVVARIQGGTGWFNEVWFAVRRDQEDQLDDLKANNAVTLIDVPDCDVSTVLELAIRNQRPQLSPSIQRTTAEVRPAPNLATLQPQVTCVLNVHREREILLPTLRSTSRMMAFTRRMGVTAELVIVCDDSDSRTRTEVSQFAAAFSCAPTTTIDIQQRDLGAARNAGIAAARGEYICILDGDDLYSENWVTGALASISKVDQEHTVVHPALNVYFGREHRYFQHPTWDSPDVPRSGLLFENYWTSLSFGRASLYRRIPFAGVDMTTGFGFEDWHWNMQVLASGGTHIVAERTCHLIRLKEHGSLNQDSAERRCLTRPSVFVRELIRS
jgi:glycosyltransferase involved in cell wall biosynthesis